MQSKNKQSESGSAALEIVVGTLLMTLPLPLGFELFQVQSNQLLAETIARHALRGAILQGHSLAEYEPITNQIAREIQLTWNNKSPVALTLNCDSTCGRGSSISLGVRVGTARAVQTQVLER